MGVDLAQLDAVVISHRHGDHTSGLSYLLSVNPEVKIFTPQEAAFFKNRPPDSFLNRHPGLPQDLQYYEGRAPLRWTSGSPWENAEFRTIAASTELFPGFHVLVTRSDKPGTMEMNELSLAIRTPAGLAVIVGCSHPGVERIVREAARIDSRIHLVAGGFHLVQAPSSEVKRTVDVLFDELRSQRIAPGHCTSEAGFAAFLQRFGDRFERAGLGDVLPLP
jgi:7,8-dihydropterin-6-yl-methyl-4-(beta-D-ribofuranosyl)aminobenzene 5'-phosphate synthase